MIKTSRKNLTIVIVTLIIILIAVILFVVISNRKTDVKTFNLSDYQLYIDNSTSKENVGPIQDKKDALEKAENLFIEKYGIRVKLQRPYEVFYDEETNVWLIMGSLRRGWDGGTACVLIQADTGDVLAIWHGK